MQDLFKIAIVFPSHYEMRTIKKFHEALHCEGCREIDYYKESKRKKYFRNIYNFENIIKDFRGDLINGDLRSQTVVIGTISQYLERYQFA